MMNHKIFLLSALTLVLAACANKQPHPQPQQTMPPVHQQTNQMRQQPANSPRVGMANPASVYCEQQGGKSVIRRDAKGGEYGECLFPSGHSIDEWTFYRKNHPN